MAENKALKPKKIPLWARLGGGFLLAEAGAVALSYYWRVFYDLGRRGISGAAFTLAVCAVAGAIYWAAAAVCHFVKNFDAKCAACIFLCGLLFVFANPPLQAPDEHSHFLRTFQISMGHFDFDAARDYPESVDRLISAFPGAWVTAHTSVGVSETQPEAENGTASAENTGAAAEADTADAASAGQQTAATYYSTAGYALKQYGENGTVESIADGFGLYFGAEPANQAEEPLNFMILPYLPAALFMAVARLFGLAALGCLYAGRIANLTVYALLCFAALRGCKRYKPVFLALMLLPLSLYLAGSLSYDAILLGCYYYAASLYCREEITDRSLAGFAVAFFVMNATKPWINLLWLAVPLMMPKKAWKARLAKWQLASAGLIAAVGVNKFIDWYGVAARTNYGEIGRMLDDVAQLPQLRFILSNPLRYLAVMAGTLYENQFFIGQLGVFGALDMPVAAISLLSAMALVFGAALAVNERSRLQALPAAGLGGLAVVYGAGAITAMYITYTPVGMVRVIGLQARYFLPCFLLLTILLAALLSHILSPRENADGTKSCRTALGTFAVLGALGAILLMQHYCIGPVYTIR